MLRAAGVSQAGANYPPENNAESTGMRRYTKLRRFDLPSPRPRYYFRRDAFTSRLNIASPDEVSESETRSVADGLKSHARQDF